MREANDEAELLDFQRCHDKVKAKMSKPVEGEEQFQLYAVIRAGIDDNTYKQMSTEVGRPSVVRRPLEVGARLMDPSRLGALQERRLCRADEPIDRREDDPPRSTGQESVQVRQRQPPMLPRSPYRARDVCR